jgi:cell division protease FtsH
MPLEPGVALQTLAAATPGFSGAALAQLANEAALAAAQRGGDKVSQADLEQARERVAKTLEPAMSA